MKITMTSLKKAMELEPELITKDTDLNEVEICMDWISTKKITNKINRKIGNSYHLKHEVEAWACEYVSNQAFIAAVLILGIPYKKYPGYPNIDVALE